MTVPFSKSADSDFSLTLFGPIEIKVVGEPLPHLHSRKSLWVLALLVLRHGRPVERDWLAGTVWPECDQDQSMGRLRSALSDLRKALGSEGRRLQSPNRQTVLLELSGADVDVLEFDEAIANRNLTSLERAVALHRGPLLEGCPMDWAGQERAVREQGCLRALQTLADAAMAAGDWTTAAEHLRRAVALDPWLDAARRRLMEALAKGGDVNAALYVYRQFVALLREDPSATPDEQTALLYQRLRSELRRSNLGKAKVAEPTHKEEPKVSGYLPHPLTVLLGREDERQDVADLLQRSRLVTLTGPGGIGKTRLAIAVSDEVAADYTDSVWLVSLEAVSDAEQLPSRIAWVLGVKEEAGRKPLDSLIIHLRDRRLLLVLDNCEHLLDATARLTGHILKECARLSILATCREPLRVTGEVVWPVPGLSVPDPVHLPTGQASLVRVLKGYDGVQLFIERAQAVASTFMLTGGNAPSVAQVCARLGGIPLALELAAARVRAMTVEQLAARLDDHLALLTDGDRAAPTRQQTLRATLDWSYELLSHPEQIMLARLSVFAGGWTLDAAEAVCSGDGIAASQVLDRLTSLVDKSLATFSTEKKQTLAQGGRYRILEMVRQYAAERLAQNGAASLVRGRHRDWFLALAEEAESQVNGASQAEWLDRLDLEHDNLRSALLWCECDTSGGEAGLRLVGALTRFWTVRGHGREGRQFADKVLGHDDAQKRTATRSKALHGAGRLAYGESKLDEAQCLFEESLQIAREVEDLKKTAGVLASLSHLYIARSEHPAARALLEESLDIFRKLGDKVGTAQTLSNLGSIHHKEGDDSSALALFEKSLGLLKEIGDKRSVGWTLCLQGNIANSQGERARARAFYEESLDIFEETGDKWTKAMAARSLGNLEADEGHLSSARRWLEESVTIYRDMGDGRSLGWSLINLGNVLKDQAAYAQAREAEQEGLALFEAAVDRSGAAAARCFLGDLALVTGNTTGARAFFMTSLSSSRDLNYMAVGTAALEGLAGVLLAEQQPERSARLWGAAAALRDILGTPLSPKQEGDHHRVVSHARAAMGEAAFDTAFAEGRTMTWEQAVAFALDEINGIVAN